MFIGKLLGRTTKVDKSKSIDNDDLLFNLVKDIQFLHYEHKIEEVKTSRFVFPAKTENTEFGGVSDFGLEVIQKILHIGLVNLEVEEKRCPVLLTVWPSFVSPAVYEDSKTHLAGLKKVKTLIFSVPEFVYEKYSGSVTSTSELLMAAAVLAPVEEWKYLENEIMTSFYNFIADQSRLDSFKTKDVWNNYKGDLDKKWKQVLFICCEPSEVAFYVRKMLKRNSARIAENVKDTEKYISNGYELFLEGDALSLIIQWSKFTLNQDNLVAFLAEINAEDPILSPRQIMEKMKFSFAHHVANVKKHRCELCPYETDHGESLTRHMRTHSGAKPFECHVCGKTFNVESNLRAHLNIHSGIRKFSCKYCGRKFDNSSKWRLHVARHETSEEIKFECYSCKHITKDETDLENHMLSHADDAKFQCSVCLKTFDSENKLTKHKKIHTEKKAFKCHICEKEFTRNNVLTKHILIHSPPTFDCDFCVISFTHNYQRLDHQLRMHREEMNE